MLEIKLEKSCECTHTPKQGSGARKKERKQISAHWKRVQLYEGKTIQFTDKLLNLH